MYELGIVKRNIVRADKAAVETMGKLGSATVHEAQGRVGRHAALRVDDLIQPRK